MYFAAWAARAGIAHFPEVIFFVSFQYAVFSNVLLPVIVAILVKTQVLFAVAFKHGNIQAVFRQLVHFGQ